MRSTLLLLFVCLLNLRVTAQVKPIRRLLILNEVGTTYPLINLVDQGIRTSLAGSPYRIEFYREYMETVLFPDPADQQFFRDFYIRKYHNRRPDVIIVVGPSPLKFMLETHQKIFAGIPVVFCVPNKLADHITLGRDFTGVEADIAPAETIAVALRLLPDTKHIVVVGGMAPFDRQQQEIVRTQLTIYSDRIDISYLTDLDLQSLLQRLKHLPAHTILLLGALGRDAMGQSYNSDEIGPMIVAAANAPVFSMSDRYLNHGEIGGKVSSGFEEGKIVGAMALRILKGEEVQKIPGIKAATKYMFDSRALKRWGINQNSLPPGSMVINRNPSFWVLYRRYFIIGALVLLAQTAAIFALLWQRAQRRKVQTELRESEEMFSKAFQRSPLALTLASLKEYRFLEVNDTFEDYTGWTRDEVVGRTSRELGIWVDNNQRSVFIEDLLDKSSLRNIEVLFRAKDGHVWTGLVSAEVIDLDGEPSALCLIADITEAKKTERARMESEERFRLVANAAPVMIWTAGPNKLCDYCNQPWLDFTGRPLEAELGHGWAERVHAADLDACMRTYTDFFDRREPFRMEYRIMRHDGQYRWVLDIGVPRFNSDGSFAGYIGSCIDVTERKIAEEALRSVSRRLIQAQEQERVRIARELHDNINQRVAMLAVDLDTLEQQGSETLIAFQPAIREMRLRALDLSNEVHALSHYLHSSKLEYLGLVGASKAFCRELSDRHKVEIKFETDNVPPGISSEISLTLFRVLQESLQNAIKYSEVKSFYVRMRGFSDEVQLIVCDKGKGFDANVAMQGHGLGLISMRERVSSVKGTIFIASTSTGGTEINVRIPVVTTREASAVMSGVA